MTLPTKILPSLATVEPPFAIEVDSVNAYYQKFKAIKNVSISIKARQVTAFIGPSGCGKSTLLRCLNRMHEEVPGARVEGKVLLHGEDIYAKGVDAVKVRRHIGMVFQKPNPFPSMSIAENVVAGVRLNQGIRHGRDLNERIERALRQAALWDDVKDKLHQSGSALSGGQQQRLCIARALAVEPEVLLMDEPCSALDPIATLKIEDLIRTLSEQYTVIIVTHNMQQAARVSNMTAFMLMDEKDRAGELVEYGDTKEIFVTPKDPRTEAYITGRFG